MSSSAAPRYNKDYHRYLVKFMSFKDNIQYDKKHNFDDAQLEDWKPGEIFEWMRQSTLKDVQVSEVDKQTTKFYLRSSTLAVMKKALSWYFVGDRDSQWVTRLSTGNPTKSNPVNGFIRFIKKCEVRKFNHRKMSKAASPLTMTMFRAALRILEGDQENYNNYYRYTAMLKFQYYLIGRSDDLGNFETLDLKSHSNPLFSQVALMTKVHWSKNVMDERECPDQILFGAWDIE